MVKEKAPNWRGSYFRARVNFASMSPYVYAENNPVLKNDPTGLLTQAQFDAIVKELLKDDGGEGDIWYPDENGGGGRYDWRDQPIKWMIEYLNSNDGWQYTKLGGKSSGFSSNVFDFKGETYFAGVEFVDGKAMSMVVNSLEIVEPGAYMKAGEYHFWEAGQGQNVEVMQAGVGVGDLLTSIELAIAAFNPSFQAAASQAKHGGDVPLFLKKNIFKSPHVPNNNALYLGKVSSSLAKNGATILKVAAPALTVSAVVTNGVNIFADGQLTYGDAFVAANTALQIAFPIYGVAYGLVDVGSSFIFGQSLTDYTKNYIDSNTSGSINLGY